ncbi:mediator of RNA polymerase II transcription subunit 11-like [Mercenaria mercenaria]|uniref:mediator of RNA polymerase II transcription subunit 11-like n=1 Tax=Mercenaria mercenaria TaxID=6596 RepID=UPI001E1D4C57|nr:mediator of RNA polymerase II transcription subunit 11-like [Mercenaria mercenaria]
MASSISPMERLQQLEGIEKEISTAILNSGKALEELAKEKPQMKTVETHTTGFIKTLESVEAGLMKQIQYLTQVSTGQPHEGSCYAAQKDLLMAYHRKAHVQSRLEELEKIHAENRPKHLQLSKSYSLPPMAQGPGSAGN